MPPTDPQLVSQIGDALSGHNMPFDASMPLPKTKGEDQCYADKTVTVRNGTTLAVRIWGDEELAETEPDRRWIAVHGFLDNAASYDRLAPSLLERLPASSCIVAFDQAGHGLSDRRASGVYYGADWASDVIQLADSLGWEKFSIVSHSLGGMVSYTVAAIVPDRVLKLVVIEAIGFFSQDSTGQLQQLRRAVTQRPKGQNIQKYDNLEAASARRAEMNMGGKLPIDAARLLVQRGTQMAPDGSGYMWSTDPALLGAWRDAPSEEFVKEILSGVCCPTLLIVAEDGIWRKARLGGQQLFSLPWSILVSVTFMAGMLWHFCTSFSPYPKGEVEPMLKGAPFIRQLEFLWKLMTRRWRLRTTKVHHLKSGGHHPQLTVPNKVADAVSLWLSQQSR